MLWGRVVNDIFIQIAGCEMHKWYKRFAYTDPDTNNNTRNGTRRN